MRLGLSTYSLWHFRGDPYPVSQALEDAARWGVAGVEILEVQLGEVDRAELHRLRRQAFLLGLDVYAVSTHQDFVSPHKEERQRQIAKTVRSLEVAEALGAACIRVNSGRWKTIPSFDALMAAGGREPPLPGYTEDDARGWVVESLEALLPEAERRGILLGLENHWGLTSTADGVLRILDQLPSPYVAAVLDTGNFPRAGSEMYEELDRIAPRAVLVHAKSYLGGGEWYDLPIDYHRIREILVRHGYRGYVSLEFEGRMDPHQGVPEALAELRDKLGIG